ncbi:MAG: hypothetical protein ACJAQ6_002428 [Arenicella sp.]|jgi:hypothetical protein
MNNPNQATSADPTKPTKAARINKPRANKRSWVSISLIASLVGMAITGVLSYLLAYSESIAGIHTWFGIAFIFLMIFHLRNNFKTLINYVYQYKGKQFLSLSVTGGLVLTVGVLLALPPFSSVLEFGKNLRKSISVEEGSFQTLTTNVGDQGIPIEIELRKGLHYESEPQPLFLGLSYTTTPQVAFWLEDLAGRYISTIYVTQKISNGSFVPTDNIFKTVSRPESLPYWAHQRGVSYADNALMPSADNTDLDGMTGATPLGNYDVRSKLNTDLRQFKVMMEINRSYDFNGFYTKDKYPDDAVYSGSGSSGQPSVIYSTEINLDENQHTYIMTPIGHGHYSGQDGKLYDNFQGIDTALQLVKRVVVGI